VNEKAKMEEEWGVGKKSWKGREKRRKM